MRMRLPTKLNLGCGYRYRNDPSWENVDFPGWPPLVKRVDLRHPLPYAENQFEFVYGSHVLDHFPLVRIRSLLGEIRPILRPGGILRLAVPDLERNAQAYLRSVQENRGDPLKHHWHTIELIDQMTRAEFGGEKAKFLRMARTRPDMQAWLRPLLGYEMRLHLDRPATPPTLKTRLKEFVKKLLFRRSFEVSGERHHWTFDEISLRHLLCEAGFARVERMTWETSLSTEFLRENLDMQDGVEYKPGSLYMEAVK